MADKTVNPSGGAMYTTIAAAVAACGPSDWVVLMADITESVIFYSNEKQKDEALQYIRNINESTKDGKPVVTEVVKLNEFYTAENYHKDYFEHHKDEMYCQLIINPKLKKVEDHFASLLKSNAK